MAKYRELKGITVQTRDSDPVVGGGSWSSGGDLNTAKYLMGGAGTISATIVAGGDPSPNLAFAELYNGSSWTEVADLATARGGISGNGTSLSGIAFGGMAPPYSNSTELWTAADFQTKTVTTS